MSGIFVEPDDAATPLTPDEKKALKPTHIATRGDLNLVEQENILRGQDWALARRRDILTERFIMELHRHMFGDVWRWAGTFRTSERNIGIDHWLIPTELKKLVGDVRAQTEAQSHRPGEIAVRFHHRLVQIHPFPNGNGRHARMAADLLIMRLGGERFSWGSGSLCNPGALRKAYIAALKAADAHDIEPLMHFARS
ncbi:MAG TPA: mobile mystery protein B [Magnetospirillaceae bacterium]